MKITDQFINIKIYINLSVLVTKTRVVWRASLALGERTGKTRATPRVSTAWLQVWLIICSALRFCPSLDGDDEKRKWRTEEALLVSGLFAAWQINNWYDNDDDNQVLSYTVKLVTGMWSWMYVPYLIGWLLSCSLVMMTWVWWEYVDVDSACQRKETHSGSVKKKA